MSFRRTIDLDAFVLRSESRQESGDPWAGRAAFRWTPDLYTARLAYTHVGSGYRNDLGFVPRRGVGITTWEFERNLRPVSIERHVRQLTIGTEGSLYTDAGLNRWLSRDIRFDFSVEFQDGGRLGVDYDRIFEDLDEDFEIDDGITVSPGTYRFDQVDVTYLSDPSRQLSGSVGVKLGQFWNGDITEWRVSARTRTSEHLAAELSYERSVIQLPAGTLKTALVGVRMDYSFTTTTFLSAYVQYNSLAEAWFSNVRFNLIHRPLSDIFVVYNELRPTDGTTDHVLTLKYTHRLGL